MNKLKTMLCAACALFLVMGVSARADSSNFAGPYIGIQALGLGAEFDGTGRSSAGTSGAVTDKVQVGAAVATYGVLLLLVLYQISPAAKALGVGPSLKVTLGTEPPVSCIVPRTVKALPSHCI